MNEAATKRYDIQEEIGRGAMGIVYKARDRELEETVALKILPDNLLRNPEAVRRFRQEARNARRLSHPNVVRIHDIGEEQGRKYISMELVTGSDLKHKLRACGRKLPFADVLRYSMQLCEAMAYAHSIGIVHRDIKPANLMLTKDDQVKVTDFGIAKMIEQADGTESTKIGAIIGTPLYMSPEQVKGEQVDHRADIYSMGIVFYELASGYPPFVEGDLSYQHLHVEPKPLVGVPDAFAAVVTKCLAKDPNDRWQHVTEIMEALKAVPAA
jgi:serine/threonine-protein kinase